MKILYHANCNDGSGAALAAWMLFGETTATGEPIDYIPVQYGSPAPNCAAENVYILDFCYPRQTLIEMATHANLITVIDHHKTARDDLSEPFPEQYNGLPLCEVRVTFDMRKSGAVLAWEHFNDSPPPQLLQHIQDRDLWRFELPQTREITTGLQLTEDWRNWEELIRQPHLLAAVAREGQTINRYLAMQSEKIIQHGPRYWDIEQTIVPVYNLPKFMSPDTLHLALEKYPDASYAVAYFALPDQRIYSLRARPGETDVSAIAKKHGGGGHVEAAGFTVQLHPTILARMLREI